MQPPSCNLSIPMLPEMPGSILHLDEDGQVSSVLIWRVSGRLH
jgi:hypothetical protein